MEALPHTATCCLLPPASCLLVRPAAILCPAARSSGKAPVTCLLPHKSALVLPSFILFNFFSFCHLNSVISNPLSCNEKSQRTIKKRTFSSRDNMPIRLSWDGTRGYPPGFPFAIFADFSAIVPVPGLPFLKTRAEYFEGLKNIKKYFLKYLKKI